MVQTYSACITNKKPELLNDILQETEIAVKCSVLDACFSFDVGRSMFDVGCSSFKTTPYGINVTCECLHMGFAPNISIHSNAGVRIDTPEGSVYYRSP